MAKKNPKDAPVDFDALLSDPTPNSENEESENAEEESPAETPEQRRIRELEEELSKPLPEAGDVSFEEVEKTPEQIRIEELEAKLAVRNANILNSAPDRFEEPQGDVILMHVVKDGFTAFGRVWYRGQELRLDKAAMDRTRDRHGRSWVETLLNDEDAQYRKWGERYIAPGPFRPRPGEVFDDALVKEDSRRRGAVPIFDR